MPGHLGLHRRRVRLTILAQRGYLHSLALPCHGKCAAQLQVLSNPRPWRRFRYVRAASGDAWRAKRQAAGFPVGGLHERANAGKVCSRLPVTFQLYIQYGHKRGVIPISQEFEELVVITGRQEVEEIGTLGLLLVECLKVLSGMLVFALVLA